MEIKHLFVENIKLIATFGWLKQELKMYPVANLSTVKQPSASPGEKNRIKSNPGFSIPLTQR